MELNKK
jgi:hypothetical protein